MTMRRCLGLIGGPSGKPPALRPLSLDDMLGWIDTRAQILQALDSKRLLLLVS
jgi:hypothetical protein